MTTRTTPNTWTITRLEQALLDHLNGRQDWPKQSEWYSTTHSTRLYGDAPPRRRAFMGSSTGLPL